jgi:hypothetical protein
MATEKVVAVNGNKKLLMSVSMEQITLVYMIFMVMYGNGVKITGMKIIMKRPLMVKHG